MRSFRFTSPEHNVNLWIVPLKMSLAAVVLFAITITPDTLAAKHVIHIPDWFTMGGIDDARAILSAMLGCVSTVLALIFSVALLVLSMVANLFGPRLLYRFVQDWVTQACIGLFMGAFVYCFLVFLVTHQDEHTSFIPQVSLITSWLLVLAAFGFLVYYSHRVAALIQNPDAIGRIVDDLRRVANAAPLVNAGQAASDQGEAETIRWLADEHNSVPSELSGYIQGVDHRALLLAATSERAQIALLFRPGQFVIEGEALAVVSPPSARSALTPVILRGVALGRHRVLAQDLEFGIAQIVEIAIRALSPAINDTFTGVACVDLMGESLTILAEAPRSSERHYDEAGVLRLEGRPLPLARLIKFAFDQIRQAAADNPAVLIRMLSILGRLVPKTESQEELDAIRAQAAAVWESAKSKVVVNADLQDIEGAWQRVEACFADQPSSEFRVSA
jgi:uncharacterized membrane protein